MSESIVTREPKPSDEPRPFQFTIWSLMLFTASLAVFFALATQTHAVITLSYALVASGIWMFPGYWRGIFALALCLFTYMVFVAFGFWLPVGGLLITASFLSSQVSAIYAIFSTNLFDKIAGMICVFLSFLLVLCSLVIAFHMN